MSNLLNILFAVPIAIIYNIIIHKLGDIFNDDVTYNERIQKNLLLSFGGAILAIYISMSLLCNTCSYKNIALQYGLYLSALLLLLHSLFYNWSNMQNNTKFIIMIVFLSVLIYYSYKYSSHHTSSNTKIKNTKKNKLYQNYQEPMHDKTDTEKIIDIYE